MREARAKRSARRVGGIGVGIKRWKCEGRVISLTDMSRRIGLRAYRTTVSRCVSVIVPAVTRTT